MLPENGQVKKLVIDQNEIRTTWGDNDTAQFLRDYFFEEWGELEEALLPPEREQCRWEVASELGDIEYLSIRYEQFTGEPLPADMLFFRTLAWQHATYMDINMGQAVHMKVVRNDLKYPVSITNQFEYKKGREICKQLWENMGGDKEFYGWYASVFGEI